MARITQKGRDLAHSIGRSYPAPGLFMANADNQELCSLICRHARTYCRIQEEQCDGPAGKDSPSFDWDRWGRRLEKREAHLEARIETLCAKLPEIDGKPIRPIFGGDPRGATVKLKMPDGRADDWGREGVCVPGS